jgi:hypothetical protein
MSRRRIAESARRPAAARRAGVWRRMGWIGPKRGNAAFATVNTPKALKNNDQQTNPKPTAPVLRYLVGTK